MEPPRFSCVCTNRLPCNPSRQGASYRTILRHIERPCNSGLKPLKRGAPPTAKARGFPRLKAGYIYELGL